MDDEEGHLGDKQTLHPLEDEDVRAYIESLREKYGGASMEACETFKKQLDDIARAPQSKAIRKLDDDIHEKQWAIDIKERFLKKNPEVFSETERRAIEVDIERKRKSIEKLKQTRDKKASWHIRQLVNEHLEKVLKKCLEEREK